LKISCPNCAASYELDDSRVPAAGLSIKCPKCKNPFTVHKAGEGKAAIKPSGPVPLPGMGGAKPPGARPITKPVLPKNPAGAVPLPGLGGAPAAAGAPPAAIAPPPPPSSGAVPLPGLHETEAAPRPPPSAPAAPRPPPASRAVPLPGLGGDSQPVDLALDVTSQDLERTSLDSRPLPPRSAPPAATRASPGAVPLPGIDLGSRPPPAPEADPFATALTPKEDPLDPFASIELGAPMQAKPAPARPAAPPPPDDDIFAVDMSSESKPAAPKPALLPDDGMGFDFPETPAARPPKSSSDMDLLDFVDEAPKPSSDEAPKADKGRRPPPPTMAKGAPPPEETLETEPRETAMDAPPAEGAEEEDPKKAEKARKKREREEKVERDREARAQRKAAKAAGGGSQFLPALKQRAEALKSPRALGLGAGVLVVLVVVVMGFRARRTPAGFFWMNSLVPSKRAATAAEGKVIENGLLRLGQGDFVGAREAVAAGAQLLGVLPDDEEVKAFFVLAASELKLEYGQAGGDWDQAKRVVEKMKGTRPSQNRARAAFALASGDFAKGRALLAGLADAPTADLESTWLYADAQLLGGEPPRAAATLDAGIKTRPTAAKLLLLRGSVAELRGQPAEAADFFQRVLKQSPDNVRAMVELAAVRTAQKDAKGAQELLAKALDTDLRKTLDAAAEARGNTLRGNLAAAAHDPKVAEAAYERALALDPTAPSIHEAYGRFRLARREWDKAARQFEASIASGNASADAYAGAATSLLGTNRLLEADKDANQAVSKDGNNAHYIYLQGRVAEAIGKGDEAYRKYDAALAKKPDSAEALVAQGQMLLLRNDKVNAKAKLTAALATPQANRSSIEDETVGELALAMGDKAGAKSLFTDALAKDPDDPIAHAGLGKALAAQGDYAAAKKELEIAVSQVDGDAGIQYEYGSVLRQMGQPDLALEALRKAVKLDGKDSRYRSRLGAILVERGEVDEAQQQLQQATLMDARNAEGHYFLGRAYAGKKNLTEALNSEMKAVELDPDNAEYWYWQGLVYEMGQQVQDAIDSLQKSIGKNPKNADAHEHLGLNLMVENRFGDAVAAFKKAADIDPKRARLWGEVGDAEQQSGDTDGAIRDFQRALAQDGKLTGIWTKLGVAYKDKDCKGCRTRAEDALQHAIVVDAKDASAHHELGYMYKDDGKRKEAMAEFQRYLELRPDAGDAASVQDDIYYLKEESRRAP
jgi:cellulose synthase operon protein C